MMPDMPPEVMDQYVAFLATESFMLAAVFVVAAVVAALLFRKFARWLTAQSVEHKGKFNEGEYHTGSMFCRAGQVIVPILLVGFCCHYVHRGVKVLVAPRVVLIEEVASVVKDMGEKK